MQQAEPDSFSAPPKSPWPVLAVIGANVALASGPLFVRLADTGPVASAFWRIALAVPVLFAASVLLRERPVAAARGLWSILVVAGIAFAADLAAWHIGIVRTTLANATLFGNSASFIYPLYGFLIARAWPTRTQGWALALAGIGAALLLGRSAELSPRNLAGDLFCLLAGVLYAIYFILMARVRVRMQPFAALAVSSAATALPLLAFAAALGEAILPGNWTPLLLLALCSQVIGQGLMIYALGHLSPLVLGLALLLQPAVAAAIGWAMFGERLAALDVAGAVLVAIALVLVRRAPARPAIVARAAQSPRS
ncbi:DMT family transporter [Sphingomonas baiyangensis]|uniref:DMT family transporter n=1 Tax=Sphingomonas baiyangensis TaxID=2572576 RepID=A0A4U1L6G6_9SPHN|nr:DMT family transporter [Sphingomonas baiyangensis]TKD51816.1 DMT family transporter [Sphingomonas baiyangensis]